MARVAGLETRLDVCVQPGPEITFKADVDQLEQLLINLVRNAVDAFLASHLAATDKLSSVEQSAASSNGVVIRWDADAEHVALEVEDEGTGLLNPANVFTPFYTTKTNGSGVGLVLCRRIAEAHGGTIEIANRTTGSGCLVKVILPKCTHHLLQVHQ